MLRNNCRELTNTELQTQDIDFQCGIEFIAWYVPSPDPSVLDFEILIKELKECLEIIKEDKITFPIDRYNNYEDITYIMGAVYAEIYVQTFNWKLIFLTDIEEYAVLSPDNNFAIRYHSIIYQILTGLMPNNLLLGYNLIKESKFPEYAGSELNFIF